tara:strand:- start:1527 stop:2918 length:1392 start_codon:yes stop_codon:yes gene_type:complete
MAHPGQRCYICYGDAADERLLERKCGCRGDSALVHASCVITYARTRLDTVRSTYDYRACSTCRVSYHGELARLLLGALDTATAERPPEDPDRLVLKLCYADMHFFDLEDTKALEVLQQLCRVAERVPVGAASFDWHIRCPVLLATAHANLEQRVEAERTLQPPLRLLNSADGVPLHLALWARRAIAKVQMKLGHQEESERMMRAARAMDLERPHKHRAEANSISLRLDLAEVLEHGGKTQEACQVLEQLVPDARRVFGPKHGVTCDVYMQLCTAYQSLRLPAKTEDLLQGAEILDMDLELCDDKDVLLLAHKRAAALLCRGKYAEALRWLHPLAHAFERVSGASSEDALAMQSDLAFALRELGRLGESEALYRRLLDAERELYGARHATTLSTQGMLGFVLMRAGRFTVRVRACVRACACVCACVRACAARAVCHHGRFCAPYASARLRSRDSQPDLLLHALR